MLETLIELQQDANTCIIFTSDNGGLWHAWNPVEADDVAAYRPTPRGQETGRFGHQSNAHFRGTKADIWEGGHRVPFVVRFPSTVASGQVCDQLIELTDVMATVAGLLGVPLPGDAGPDSKDLSGLLRGGQDPVRQFAIHHSLQGVFAIRSGNWKLIPQRGSGGFSLPKTVLAKPREPRGQLYNLAEDPSETTNVWMSNPATVESLTLILGDVVAPLERQRIEFTSTADGSQQAAILIQPKKVPPETSPPETSPRGKTPLVVNLHSWSADMMQRSPLVRLVHDRGWLYLAPNFRGVNQRPEACGSPLAQQDVLDAVQWAIATQGVDPDRVYLTGASGGGHMTMLMAGLYPDQWKAAVAWVGISDLVAWHRKHQGSRYGEMLEKCCGGAPGDSPEIDSQYAARSPLHVISRAHRLPLDILAGADDGHTGSVPIGHSIEAFNQIARANGTAVVTAGEIEQLSQRGGRLQMPRQGDEGFDAVLGRQHFLRRQSGPVRLTIFDGGHESIAEATMDWFVAHP